MWHWSLGPYYFNRNCFSFTLSSRTHHGRPWPVGLSSDMPRSVSAGRRWLLCEIISNTLCGLALPFHWDSFPQLALLTILFTPETLFSLFSVGKVNNYSQLSNTYFFLCLFFKGILPPRRGQHGPWRLLWTRWSVEPRRPAGMAKNKELLMVY